MSAQESVDAEEAYPLLAMELERNGELLLVLPDGESRRHIQEVRSQFEGCYKRMFGDQPVMHVLRQDGDLLVLVYRKQLEMTV